MTADFLELAWRQTWQVTLLAGAIGLLVSLCGRNRPHLAHALWLAVLLKCLTPPIWSSAVGLFCWLQPAEAVPSAEPVPVILQRLEPNQRPQAVSVDDVSTVVSEDFAFAETTDPPARDLPAPGPTAAPRPADSVGSLTVVLLAAAGVWLAGCLTWLTVTLVRSVRCWREISRAVRPVSPELLALLERLRRQLQIRQRVRLVISATRVGPAVMGLFRPVIVLPEIIVADRPECELEPILAHELIHVRRGDLWIGCLQTLTCGLWWFHPLVRGTCRALAREAERCVDEELISALRCDPARYARTLLTVLELKQTLRPVPVFPGMKPIEITSQRLERIMSLRQGCRNRSPWWCWSALALTLAAALPGRALIAVDEPGAANAGPRGPRVERIERFYDVPEVIARLARNEQVETTEAARMLADGLTREGVSVAIEDQTTLRILAPASVHQEIAAQLGVFREITDRPSGPITTEAVIYNVPREAVDRLLGPPDAAPANDLPRAATSDARLESKTSEQPAPSQVTARIKLLTEQAASDLQNQLREIRGVEKLSAPMIRMFDRQSATVSVGNERAFVTGYEQADEPGAGAQPLTARVQSGFELELRPARQANQSIELAAKAKLSTITEVKQSTVFVDGQEKPVEHPAVSQVQAQATAMVDPEQTLVLVIPANNARQALLVLLKPRSAPEAETAPPARANASAAAPAQIQSFSATHNHRVLSLGLPGWTLMMNSQAAGEREALLDFQTRQDRLLVTGSGRVSLALSPGAAGPEAEAELLARADVVKITSTANARRDGAAPGDQQWQLELHGHVELWAPSFGLTCEKASLQLKLPAVLASPAATPPLRMHLELSGDVRLQQKSANGDAQGSQVQAESLSFTATLGGEPVTVGIIFSTPAASRPKQPEIAALSVRSYPVADLVIPVPKLVSLALPALQQEPEKPVEAWKVALGQGLRIGIPLLAKPGAASGLPLALDLALPVSPTQASVNGDQGVSRSVVDLAGFTFPAPVASPTTQAVATDKAAQGVVQAGHAAPELDPQPLRKLIETRIAPESWQARGGQGVIEFYPKTASLIIRQTPEVHQQIAELLGKLRREQDVQVTLELKVVRFPDDQWLKEVHWTEPSSQLVEGLTLSPDRTEQFRKLDTVQKSEVANRFPKVTLFNEQTIEFSLPVSADKTAKPLAIAMGAVVDLDRRGLRLNLACNTTDRADALAGARSFRLPMGDSLLIDIGPEAALAENIQGVPILQKIPHVNRLFRNANPRPQDGQPAGSLMLLVTPRGIILEEEELQILPPVAR